MRKLLKFTGILLLALLVVLTLLYFWLINHAEQIVQQFIYHESNGNVDLRISKVRYDHAGDRLILYDTRVVSADTTGKAARYDITAKKFILRIGRLRDILATGSLNIDSIRCESPKVHVSKLRPGERREVSIPEEMSKVYRFLENTLKKLRIHQLRVVDGEFSIRKEYMPGSETIRINRISLAIDDLHLNEKKGDEARLLFSDRIFLEARDQDIRFFDGRHGLRFSRFWLNTQTGRIELDSCLVYGHRKDSVFGSFDIFFDSLRFTHTDLNMLARRDIIKADSALCINPRIRFLFELKNRPGSVPFTRSIRAKDSVETAFKELLGNLDIGFIGVRNAAVDITARRNDQESRYSSGNSNFTIQDLQVLEDPARPIHIGRFDVEIRDYIGYSSDSLYAIRFDSIQLMDDKLFLNNFSIHATPRNTNAEWRDMRMKAFSLEDIFWTELLFNNRLKATNARLLRPVVELNLERGLGEKRKPKGALYLALAGFRKNLEMDNLFLRDASVSIHSGNGSVLRMDDFNTGIDVKRLLRSGDPTDIIGSIQAFSFGNGSLSNLSENISFRSGRYDGTTQRLALGKATYTNNRNPLVISAEELVLTDAQRTPDNQFKASEVSWKRADIRMQRKGATPPRREAPEKPLLIGWNRTSGSDTRLTIETDETRFSTDIQDLQTGSVLIPTDGKPRINGLDLRGTDLLFRQAGIQAGIRSFHVVDEKTSAFSDIRLEMPAGRRRVHAEIPRLDMVPDLESVIDNKPSLSAILLQSPVLSFSTNTDTTTWKRRELPAFTVGELQVNSPVIRNPDALFPDDMEIAFSIPGMKASNIRSNGQTLTIGRMETGIRGLKLAQDPLALDATGMGDISATLSNFTFLPAARGGTASWKSTLEDMGIPGIRVLPVQPDGTNTPILLDGGHFRQLELASGRPMEAKALLAASPMAQLSLNSLRMRTDDDTLQFSGIRYRHDAHALGIDSMNMLPLLDREQFTKRLSFQKDHIGIRTGAVSLQDFNLLAFLTDTVMRAGRVDVFSLGLDIFRDRRLPFRTGIIKPLPVVMMNRIGTRFSLDSLRLHEGLIRYEEVNEKTEKQAIVPFCRTEALLTNVRNFAYTPTDSFTVTAFTRLADTAEIRLRFRESYADSLHGFLMSLRIGRFGLPALNGILEPMGSARILSGGMDTVHMNAVGDEYEAWGRMRMYYHDLKVQFLNREDYSRKTIITRFSNFLANTLVLRKRNLKKTGTVYTERIREKSVFNYWIRIALSGMLTNAGIRARSVEERKHHRGIRQRELPGMPEPSLD